MIQVRRVVGELSKLSVLELAAGELDDDALQALKIAADEELERHGGVWLRGLPCADGETFRRIAVTLFGELWDYSLGDAKRQAIAPGVFTSSSLSGSEIIDLHHEASYLPHPPSRIAFWCRRAAPRGGSLLVGDGTAWWRKVPRGLAERFATHGVTYLRYFGEDESPQRPSWRKTFKTDDRGVVEERGRATGMRCEWGAGGTLTLINTRPGVATREADDRVVWFNQLHRFHASRWRNGSAAEEPPSHALDGAGREVTDSDVATIVGSGRDIQTALPLAPGDVVVLDNTWLAHGRATYAGPREIFVAMSAESAAETVEGPPR